MAELYNLRLIQASDNASVARLIRQVMTEFGAVGEGYSIMDPEVDQMYEAYNNDRSVFYVIEKGNIIFGCGGIGPLTGADESICELKKMYFLPELRGLGFGRKLMEKVSEGAKSAGYHKIYLETLERMEQANHLYRKMGFKKMPAQLGNTGHCSCDAYYLKEL